MDELEALSESKKAEAANAAAVEHEATANAREAQMHNTLVKALRQVLTEGEDENQPILIKRIPFICNDIRDIKNDLKWIKYFGYGILAGIGLLALKSLGIH